MSVRAPWLLCLVLVLAAAAAAPLGAHTTGAHNAPWLESHDDVFTERAWNKRAELRKIKAGLCRPAPGFEPRWPGMVAVQWRRHHLDRLQHRIERARGYSSRCFVAHHRSLWLCVHAHEGAWNDPNEPYFGGLQMGYWFMQTYGGSLYRTKGTADNWTAEEQMAVADRAFHNTGHSLGWLDGQWPGTLTECAGHY
jgi:hypothetical protein